MSTTLPQLVCLDLAGTTVSDDGVVLSAFEAALDAAGVPPGDERSPMRDYVRKTMGESKIAVFTALFGEKGRATIANAAFEVAYGAELRAGRVAPIEGARAHDTALRAAGVRVALLTGFSPVTRDAVLATLGWRDLADTTLTPAEAGRGRPYPDLVLAAVLRSAQTNVAAVAVVGDTAADMETARRAGAGRRIGVRTGGQSDEALLSAGATDVLWSVADLPALFGIAGPR